MAVPSPSQIRARFLGPACSVYTIKGSEVSRGAEIRFYPLQSGKAVSAIVIGDLSYKIIPVDYITSAKPCPKRNCLVDHRYISFCMLCGVKLKNGNHHPDSGKLPDLLMFARLGLTATGKPKLHTISPVATSDKVIIVNKSVAKNGLVLHCGETLGWECTNKFDGCEAKAYAPRVKKCPKCGSRTRGLKASFPGEILAVAEVAGKNGTVVTKQIVAIVNKWDVFQGRGVNSAGTAFAYYFMWNGSELLFADEQQRALNDTF